MPAKTRKPRCVDGRWICTCCRTRKPVDDFYLTRYRNGKTRPRPLCKRCHNAQTVSQSRSPKRWAYRLWKQAKNRALRRGILFDLSRSFVENLLQEGRCDVTAIPFDLSEAQGSGRQNALCPTLDRVTPHFGYVESNVQVVCWVYNRAKGKDDHETVMVLVRSLSSAR